MKRTIFLIISLIAVTATVKVSGPFKIETKPVEMKARQKFIVRRTTRTRPTSKTTRFISALKRFLVGN